MACEAMETYARDVAAKEIPTLQTSNDVKEWFKKHIPKGGYKHLAKTFVNHKDV